MMISYNENVSNKSFLITQTQVHNSVRTPEMYRYTILSGALLRVILNKINARRLCNVFGINEN